MRAAVVESFDTPPTYRDFPTPAPGSPHEVVVDIVAAGLHPRVRSQADGSHYTSDDALPLVPGIDGVGRAPDGSLRYFVLPDTHVGSMAERTVVDVRRSIVLPPDCDPVQIAAAMNPAMSSWVALRQRISFTAGQSVLVLGTTGNAGRLAVQVAKHLGASHVIGAGRRPDRLAEIAGLGADVTVSLDGDKENGPVADALGSVVQIKVLGADRLGRAARDVDVVLDYLWGQPTADAMLAVVLLRTDRERPLRWVEVGSVAGPTAAIPSAALRAARLQIVGSGQGSVPTEDIVAELPDLAAEIARGSLRIDTRTVALADIATAWTDTSGRDRIVVVP